MDEHEVPAQRDEHQVTGAGGEPGRDGEGAGDEDGAAVEDEPGDQRMDVMAGATFSWNKRIERSASPVGSPGSAMSSSTRW